ncbi:TetR/AcrR family transcriptional regulator [Actinocatenispora comari]|jgi:AcrR family transcriptional regulator|uniref:TetR family transcriptional regulator n=1 Tax=Actinocatenispora comari TaxID=2807577 RepID=A0A8J4AAG2_9ACTN|nr:TetR/AcrR family transcriptional regulator [Actinocatenispora comari]GIL27721.1 TetR family transcriptional regulator [Actinocatenispora comari]
MAEVGRSDTVAARRASRAAQEQHDSRRQAIVEAAAAAIEQHGNDAALGVIAEQAGVPRPHVYRYFESKDELDLEVARHATRRLRATIRPALYARGAPRGIIRGIITVVLDWAARHPNLYRFRVRLGPSAAIPEFLDAVGAFLRDNGRSGTLPAQAVAAIIGLIDASVLWWLDHPRELTAADLTDRLGAQVWLVFSAAMREADISLES